MPQPPLFQSLDDPETLRELVRFLREGLYVTDADGHLLDASPAFLEMVGAASVDDVAGRAFDDLLVDPAPRRAAVGGIDRGTRGAAGTGAAGTGAADTGGAGGAAPVHDDAVRELELTLLRADGERRTVLDTVFQRRDDRGRVFFHGILLDVTQHRALEARVRESVTRDALTGAFNRRQLDAIGREMERDAGGGWGCLFVDVDGFGAYNVRYGQEAGDGVLVRMARFLMRHVRADEPVVRLGNDEFVVVLRGATDQRTERVARRLQLTALRTAPVAFSLGWAVRQGDEGIDELVERAAAARVPVRVVERVCDARGQVEEPV